jgi:hypothetical protein
MKYIFFPLLVSLLLLAPSGITAQVIPPSDAFTIKGQVLREWIFSLQDLDTMVSVPVADLIITNHLGESKGKVSGLRGIPLRHILDKLSFRCDKPKDLSAFYITCVATDGYKIVFSWNELFNSETGNKVYLITEKEGKKMKDMSERILLVSAADLKTGRRYLKGLSSIIVSRAQL